MLLEAFLKPMTLSQIRLANAIGMPPQSINEIALGKRTVSSETEVRLARYFGTSEKFWMGLQADYELEEVHRRDVD